MTTCPLCDYVGALITRGPGEVWQIDCEGCGNVELDGFIDVFEPPNNKLVPAYKPTRHLIAGLAAERRLHQSQRLIVTPNTWKALCGTAPQSFPERVDRLLVNLSAKSSTPGSNTSLSTGQHRPLAYAESSEAFRYALETLRKQGLIEYDYPIGGTAGVNDAYFRMTYDGWKRVPELLRSSSHSEQAFIALTRNPGGNYEPRMEDLLRKGLEVGIKSAGYRPIFMEDLDHSDRIDDRILVEIARSRFVVADTTGRNPNVSFEAGYALGLKVPVLWTCRDGDHKEQDFDIRQYKRLLWKHDDESSLAPRLAAAIEQVIGRGPIR